MYPGIGPLVAVMGSTFGNTLVVLIINEQGRTKAAHVTINSKTPTTCLKEYSLPSIAFDSVS